MNSEENGFYFNGGGYLPVRGTLSAGKGQR